VGLLLVVGFLAWRALVANLADYYANQDTTEDVVGALRWQARQPEALYQRGVELAASDPTESERLLRLSAWADPTDALVYLALAAQWAGAGRVTVAAKLVEIADILGRGAVRRWRARPRSGRRRDNRIERWRFGANCCASARRYPSSCFPCCCSWPKRRPPEHCCSPC